MDRARHLIVGAGITGLAFADHLDTDDLLICEADTEIGGYCKTIRRDGFVWDFSGHFFHFEHPEIEAELLRRMDDQRVLKVVKKSQIYFEGTYVDFPFQKNIHQLPREDFLECLVDLWDRDTTEPTNFREMVYARFGRGISERFLVPYNEKLYATDLRLLDVDAMGRFFPHADVDAIIRNFRRADNASYNSTFTYPEGGAIQYVQALAKGTDPQSILLNERVESVDPKAKVARTSAGREIAFEHLLSTAPLPATLAMAGLPADEGTWDWNKVLVFNLGFDRKGPKGLHWLYFPSREVSFYRVGFYDNIFDTDCMSVYVEIGYPKDAELDVDAIRAARRQVLSDLAATGLTDGHQVVAEHHVVLDPAYVHITRRSNAAVEEAKALLATRGIYTAGRYGSWTYCSIEDNIVEARALAARFNRIDGLE